MARDTGRGADRDRSLDDDEDTPVDLMAVRRDDALIEAIAGHGPVATADADEYRLAALLAEWREDIVSTPMPAGPSLDEVQAAMDRERDGAADRGRARSRLRMLRPVVGAAAAVAFLAGGVSAVSFGAEPGDPLWKVKEVVFTQEAESTAARVDTTSALQNVETALARGDADQARTLLAEAATRTPAVRDEQQRAELLGWWTRLNQQLSTLTPPVFPAPPAPTVTPDVPAPEAPQLPQDLSPLPSDVVIPSAIPSLPPALPLPSNFPTLPIPVPTALPGLPVPTTTTELPDILRLPVLPSTAPAPTAAPDAGEQTPN
ncbi:anti-sigma-D factor RsdA [Rhodococcoides corynebacterioides]|uniref:Type IV secretion protein Rhs n=1 Tax=Rhodococcoides corynebacterioides TaxID=53972 RepID=A0ABS7P028_9NOCA|nr:anti-sigma-D factor RsdA [Rhodococcus corynebacterioides]MBY6365747.1 type IV secretion protein Rhs [Rhodococcus corynebacterioides]MBY6406478.1 type IV secretion protein Rhs [Rhodococcus corynebacterioides]